MTTDNTGRRLATCVYFSNPDGSTTTYMPGDVPPPAVARGITNPACWERDPDEGVVTNLQGA